MNISSRTSFLRITLFICLFSQISFSQNLALNRPVEVSSTYQNYIGSNAVDGVVSDASRWLNSPSEESSISISLENTVRVGGVHIYSGYGSGTPIQDFKVQYDDAGQWVDIPSAIISGNTNVALALTFDDTVEITTNKIRLLITATSGNYARVREITIWEYDPNGIPELGTGVTGYVPVITDADIPKIYINQSGYSLNKPKRFTAPTLADGTSYEIVESDTDNVVFSGVIENNIGDFTSFNPQDSSKEYQIKAEDITSFKFGIGLWWTERVSYQGAMDFMIDSRHYVGNYTRWSYKSYGWRDESHYGWILHTLVPQYLSHPEAYNRMPSQVSYVQTSNSNRWGDLDAYNEDAPDIVKLIHWGADIIVTQGLTHENIKAQLAYFLYAWPWIKEWLPQQNYDVVKAFVFDNWENTTANKEYTHDESPEHNLLALKTLVGTTKGGLPPGRTVQPNLLLYEVALRENRADAEKYFNAAYNQTQWMIDNLDWEDPLTTKGQRVSEFLTMTGLVHFAKNYPNRMPSTLMGKIKEWAEIMIRRSENMWDFRKYTDNAEWVPFDETAATKWNEPGNVVGLPACMFAVNQVLKDKEINDRLAEIAYAHLDNCFGRNPVGRHFSYDGAREIEGVEVGWYSFYRGGIGQLANTRFVLDGAPKYNHFPYHPEIGNVGWTEGWIQHNVPFNLSLAYMAHKDIEIKATRKNNTIDIDVIVPHNFDYSSQEEIQLDYVVGNGSSSKLSLIEDGVNAISFKETIATSASNIELSYGYGFFKKSLSIESDIPMAPINLKAELVDNEVVLNWVINDDLAKGYVIERSIDNSDFELFKNLNVDVFETKDQTITSNKEVKYRIKAIGNNTDSQWSEEVSISTKNVLSTQSFNDERITVYPNPVLKGTFTIEGLSDNSDYLIYDVFGKKINYSVEKNKVILKNYSQGIYFIKILNSSKVIKFLIAK